MKFYSLYLILLISQFLFSQQWQVTDIPTNSDGQRYDDVFFLNEEIGWAANGFFAAVYKTTDGGITWEEQLNEDTLEGDHYFRNIVFLNEQIGFLGTLNGKFYKSSDGGSSWSTIENISPNPPAICGLDVVGTSTIFGCGAFFQPAYIIKSSDSGDNWTYTDMSAMADALVEIKFADENIGYAGGSDANGAIVLKTIDGGITWNQIFNSGIPGEYVWKLQILENNPNQIFGSIESVEPNLGQLIKSNDAGTSWTSLDAPETHIQAVGFIDSNTGWMGGHTTGLHQTTDGGASWTNLNVGNNLNRILIINENLAYASGTSIYKYSDQSLGIQDVNSESEQLQINFKENPVNDLLQFNVRFKGPDNIVIGIYDFEGRLINQVKRQLIVEDNLSVDYEFNVGHLASGLYFLNLHNNFNRQSIKFIKL